MRKTEYSAYAYFSQEAFEQITKPGPGAMGKGDKHSAATIDLMRQKQRERAAMRKQERAERWEHKQAMARQARVDAAKGRPTVYVRMLAAMEPGEWYARRDLMARAELPKGSVEMTLRRMAANGLVEVRRSADWVDRGDTPQGRRDNPRDLMGLTAEGVAERAKALAVAEQ